MASNSFQRLSLVRSTKFDQLDRNDPYWSFQFPTTVKEDNNISHVAFNPHSPHELLVTSGFHMRIFSRQSAKIGKTFTRFREKCYSGNWRNDGNLICAGSEEGVVRVFDKGTLARAPLREFAAHHDCCQVTTFTADGKCIVSGADDGKVKLWDVSRGEKVSEMLVHNDYVRAGAAAPNDPNIFCSGGYDNTVNMLDMRANEITMSFNHGSFVESVAVFPSLSLIVSAGGPIVKVWDTHRKKLLTTISNHTKNVSSICFNDSHTKLLTAGLDKRVNIFELNDYSRSATVEFDAPVLSMALSNGDRTLAAGTAGGYLFVRHRNEHIVKNVPEGEKHMYKELEQGSSFHKKPNAEAPFTYKVEKKDDGQDPVKIDNETTHKRKAHENRYNKLFRQFEYKKVLSMGLGYNIRRKRPEVLVAIFEELHRRNVLTKTMSSRSEAEVAAILRFLGRYLTDLNWQPILIVVMEKVIELYSQKAARSESLLKLMKALNYKVNQELRLIKECNNCIGMIESLTSRSAELPNTRLPLVRRKSEVLEASNLETSMEA